MKSGHPGCPRPQHGSQGDVLDDVGGQQHGPVAGEVGEQGAEPLAGLVTD